MKIDHIKSTSYEFYRIYPKQKGCSAITAQIKQFEYGKCKLINKKEINWYCQGATSIKETKIFIQALQKAVELCEQKG